MPHYHGWLPVTYLMGTTCFWLQKKLYFIFHIQRSIYCKMYKVSRNTIKLGTKWENFKKQNPLKYQEEKKQFELSHLETTK